MIAVDFQQCGFERFFLRFIGGAGQVDGGSVIFA